MMRWPALVVLLTLFLVTGLAADEKKDEKEKKEDKKEEKKEQEKPQPTKLWLVAEGKCLIQAGYPFSLRAIGGSVFEHAEGEKNINNQRWVVGKTITGEEILLNPKGATAVARVMKLPAEARQKLIYKHMHVIEIQAKEAARNKGGHDSMLQYWEKKFYLELMLELTARYGLTQGLWQKIKEAGDSGNWPKK